jgi:hypothetical protein
MMMARPADAEEAAHLLLGAVGGVEGLVGKLVLEGPIGKDALPRRLDGLERSVGGVGGHPDDVRVDELGIIEEHHGLDLLAERGEVKVLDNAEKRAVHAVAPVGHHGPPDRRARGGGRLRHLLQDALVARPVHDEPGGVGPSRENVRPAIGSTPRARPTTLMLV